MTVDELGAALDAAESMGLRNITLVVGPRSYPDHRVRLTPKGGPLGDLLCENSNGDIVGSFKVKAVRRWLMKQLGATDA